MKKLFQLGAFFCGLLISQYSFAADANCDIRDCAVSSTQNQQTACPADHPCEDQAVNDCWCKYVHYEPCYYTTTHCVEEQVPYTKKCCRYVDQAYEVTKCRYVPQYYTETAYRKVPEYYDVQEYRTVRKNVNEQQCKYVPKYYWKHVCGQADCSVPCPK